MNINENVTRFESEFKKIKREGADQLYDYIKNKSDMFTAPGSTKFHLSVKGGLLQHSLNVLDALKSILHDNGDGTYSYLVCGQKINDKRFVFTEENLIVVSLLHDICKTGYYKVEQRWKKDENNKWESYDAFVTDDKFPLGHGEKSCLMIQQFMKLEQAELYAIRWHMGFTDNSIPACINTLSMAIDKYPIIWALHNADMIASHFMEDTEGNLSQFDNI